MFLVEDSCLSFYFYDKLFLFILSQVIALTTKSSPHLDIIYALKHYNIPIKWK